MRETALTLMSVIELLLDITPKNTETRFKLQQAQKKLYDIIHNTNAPDMSLSNAENKNIVEKQFIENVLKDCQNNKSLAAKTLKLDRRTLYNKIRKYGIC